jgi:hypothetical protein
MAKSNEHSLFSIGASPVSEEQPFAMSQILTSLKRSLPSKNLSTLRQLTGMLLHNWPLKLLKVHPKIYWLVPICVTPYWLEMAIMG